MLEIRNIDELKVEVSKVWSDISDTCRECSDPDCLGFIPVFPEEEESLLDCGVGVVQINGGDGPIFIDSYPRDTKNRLIVSHSKPVCPYRCTATGNCTIHQDRPLYCHLYPLGPETDANGNAVWGLHTECAYVRSAHGRGVLKELIASLDVLLSRLCVDLRLKLRNLHLQVEDISARPEGPNEYIIVRKMD